MGGVQQALWQVDKQLKRVYMVANLLYTYFVRVVLWMLLIDCGVGSVVFPDVMEIIVVECYIIKSIRGMSDDDYILLDEWRWYRVRSALVKWVVLFCRVDDDNDKFISSSV